MRPENNPDCQCYPNPAATLMCMTGHMLECHYPLSCADAGCSHASEASSAYATPTLGGEAQQMAETPADYIAANGLDRDHELYARLLQVDHENAALRDRMTPQQKASIDAFCTPLVWTGIKSYVSKRMDLHTLAKSLIQYGLQVGHDYAIEHGSIFTKEEPDEGGKS